MRKSEQFGRLIKGMLNSIAAFEDKTAAVINEEIGRQIAVAPTTIERYRSGLLPADMQTIRALASIAFERAIEHLVDLALIDVWQADLISQPRYTLHPLVRSFASAKLSECPAFEGEARDRWLLWCVRLTSDVGFAWNASERLQILDCEHDTIYTAMLWASSHERYTETMNLAKGSEYYYYVRAAWEKKLALHMVYAEAARQLADPSEEIFALALHVQLLSRQGQVEEGGRFLPRLRELATQNTLADTAFFFFHHALALHAFARRDLVIAQQEWQNILLSDRQMPAHMYVGARQWIATCLVQQGQLDQARHIYNQVLEEAHRLRYERYVYLSQLRLILVDVAQGRLLTDQQIEEAQHHVQAIYHTVQRDQDHELLALTYYTRAQLAILSEDVPAACTALTEAISLYERMGLRYERDLAQTELVQL